MQTSKDAVPDDQPLAQPCAIGGSSIRDQKPANHAMTAVDRDVVFVAERRIGISTCAIGRQATWSLASAIKAGPRPSSIEAIRFPGCTGNGKLFGHHVPAPSKVISSAAAAFRRLLSSVASGTASRCASSR